MLYSQTLANLIEQLRRFEIGICRFHIPQKSVPEPNFPIKRNAALAPILILD